MDIVRAEARRKNLRLELHVEESLPRLVKADVGRLRQILLNLLSNAIKFTEGAVAVRIARLSGDGPVALPSATPG